MENKKELSPREKMAKANISSFIDPLPQSMTKETIAKPVGDKVEVNKTALDKLVEKVEALEKKSQEDDKKLEMLTAVADKGRVFNYQNKRATKKPMTIKLSVYEDKYMIGWRNAKDLIKYHPMTGVPIGEEQQMEVLLLDKEGKTTKEMINSYTRFSDIKYEERVDCEVLSKSEDFEGNWGYEIRLPDSRVIKLAAQFVN